MPETREKLVEEYVSEVAEDSTSEKKIAIREAFLKGFDGKKAGKLGPDAYSAYKAGQRYGGVR